MKYREYKKTKILATLGPASSSSEIIKDLILHGMNAARLNFSHGTHEDHKKNIETLRSLEKELSLPIAIVQDLQGPKIRVGNLENSLMVIKDQEITLEFGQEQNGTAIPVQANIFPYLKKDDSVFINDGIIRLSVINTTENSAICRVIEGGEVKTHKGINVPDTQLPDMSLTQKDEEDIAFGLQEGVDYIAISFVQTAADIRRAKELVAHAKYKPRIIAKIETKSAVAHLEEIIHESHAVMVARGDLAVELGQEEVPIVQRDIISLARKHNTPVIVATQMLESMITNPEPTRAEVSDIASGVLSEVDAVMLSAESAAGKYPVRAVEMMHKIIRRAEKYIQERQTPYTLPLVEHHEEQTSAIDAAASVLVNQLHAKLIACLTSTGKTAMRLAIYRPPAIITSITNSMPVCRQLALVWGIAPVCVDQIVDIHDAAYRKLVNDLLHDHKIDKDATIVLITGKQPGIPGHTNMIQVAHAKEFLLDEH